MQEIVNYLVRNPEIVQKLRREEVSIIGLDKEEVKGVLLGFDQLISMSSKDEIYWKPS
ncbi:MULTISPECIES: competence pheromone ComX [Bacillus]|jgi:competence protein ComX|uniref:ComX pheromone n=2 Tax=Bacillus amyloliquefaciens group TaxID=1938374 RepID=A3KLB6_BACAM|nr:MULTISPECIES: competence pheromone ComX [Bacillus]ABS75209.1 competence pheromone ComX [Bacillus velezensis FZB42]AGZ57679.1 comX [Bacillus amyloliquefaciens CC178]ANF37885.1 comX [Bacillus velezensis]ARZ59341.1 ComX [Bacillus velezensis]AVM07539.1 competence pheromone ComX [Bacillus velezensis]